MLSKARLKRRLRQPGTKNRNAKNLLRKEKVPKSKLLWSLWTELICLMKVKKKAK